MSFNTRPISSDRNITVTKEFCGYEEARFVVRDSGEWVGQRLLYRQAVMLATMHRMKRDNPNQHVFVNQPA